jgi:photosystem II stability/assembly factor-like uncharacterized protein
MRAYRAGLAGLFSLCLFLSACDGGGGGSDNTTPLPDAITISGASAPDTDTPAQFGSDVVNTNGDLSFHWDFGDGSSSTEASPSHQFAAAGDYEVVLTISNEDGAAKSATFKVSARHLAVVKDLQCSGGDSKGWCWQRPLPTGNRIFDITFVDADTGWAVGQAGQILKTSDGGTTWVSQASHVTDDLRYVRFANASVGWAVGDHRATLKTTDAGATWTRQANETSWSGQPSGMGLAVLDEMRALAIFDYDDARTTNDGGQTWTDAMVSPEEVTEDGTLWDVDYYALRKSTRLGMDEATLSFGTNGTGYLRRFTMGNARNGLLMTNEWSSSLQRMFRTSDGGASWGEVAPAGLPEHVEYLKLIGDSVAWAAGDGGLFRSANAGNSWRRIQVPDDAYDPSYDLLVKDERTLWFRHGGGFYFTTDAGSQWTLLAVAQERNQATSLYVSAGALWLTYDSRVYRSHDGGNSWTQRFGGPVEEEWTALSSVWFFDQHKGAAVGNGGWLLETSNGGRDWTRKSLTGEMGSYAKLQFVSKSTGWLSGDWGVSKTTDGGASWWTPVVTGGMLNVSDFHFADALHGWARAGYQALYRSTDGGNTWQPLPDMPFTTTSIRFLDTNVGVATTDRGEVYRTDDGGETWSLRPTGIFEQLNRVVFVGASTAWAVGEYGAVLTSTDAGLSWSRVLVPPRVSLRDVWFTDASHGWIVGDQGTVLTTLDGGKTWGVQPTIAAGDLRAAFFLDAYTGWVVGSDGMVLATATGGQ